MTFNSEKPKSLLSEPIDPVDFDNGVIAYATHPGRIKLPGGATLTGLRFDRAHIEELLKNTSVSHIYLRFIISPTSNYVTVVAGGSVPTAAHPDGEVAKTKLYDYCEPCPNVCATFI